jgi:putative peptide zinc metalloprotease protein
MTEGRPAQGRPSFPNQEPMATTLPPPKPGAAAPTEVLSPAPPAATVPRLADGVELIGLFEDSGFKEPPYIARRADGQIVQMPAMLYALAEQVDGKRPLDEVAEAFSHRIERGVSPDMAEELIDGQLRPLGIVASKDGEQHELKKVDPLLALKFKTGVIPDGVVRGITTIFRPLFLPPVMALVVAGFVGLDAWLFFVHGISQSLRHALYNPALMLVLLAGVVIATAFHEVGHATGCRYGGAKPGVMGVGIYIVWPAFYTDITDAYRLRKWGRLRTDIGGMYFNMIFALGMGAVYALTGFEAILLLIVVQTFAVIQQSLPFLRLDGYYIISDLTGVPDILMRIKPVLASLIPGRKPDPKVTELKPWVRRVVTAYIALLVPLIALMFTLMVINAPRLFATGWDSFWTHYDVVGPAFGNGEALRAIRALLQMIVLALPALGFAYTMIRVVRRGGVGAWHWSAGSPVRRSGVTLAGAGIAAAIAFTWWPNGEYRPIQPGERGTLAGAFSQIARIPSGRAALTPQRQQQLGGAPTQRQIQRRKTAPGGAGQKPSAKRGSSGSTGLQGDGTRTDSSTTPDPNATDPSLGGTATGPSSAAPAPSTATQQPPPAQPAPTSSGSSGSTTTTTPTTTTTTTPTSP